MTRSLNRRKFLALMGTTSVGVLAITACAPAAAPTTPAGAVPAAANPAAAPQPAQTGGAPTGSTDINIWVGFQEVNDVLADLVPKYNAQSQTVKVTLGYFPQRAQEEKVAATLPAGQGGELIELDKHEVYSYYANGLVEPIDGDLLDFVKKNYPADFLAGSTDEKGTMFAIPWIVNPKGMFYNKAHFREVGLDPEVPPTSVDEMMDFAVKLTKRDASGAITRAGLDLRLLGGGFGTAQKFWSQAMIPYGAKPLEKVGDKYRAGYDNDAGIKALQMYIDGVFKLKYSTPDMKHDTEAFGQEASSMFQRESWVVSYMRDNAPNVKYGQFAMPKGPADWGTVNNTIALFMPKGTKAKKEAADFVLWLCNDANTVYTYQKSGWQPGRTNVDYTSVYKTQPEYKFWYDLFTLPGHKMYDYENIKPIAEVHNRMADRLIAAFKQADLLDNPSSLKSAVSDMAKETNDVLKRGNMLAG
jgi:multiple sugar transport system substrate-binding protein